MSLFVGMTHASFDSQRHETFTKVYRAWDFAIDALVCDDEQAGSWATTKRAWTVALGTGQSHILIAQDDMLPAKGFRSFLERFVEHQPDRVFCLRWPAKSEKWLHTLARQNECYWAGSSYSYGGGATVLPRQLAYDFLEWTEEFDGLIDPYWEHRDDIRLDLFLMSRSIPVYRCTWSMLHHIGDYSVCRSDTRAPSHELGLVHDVRQEDPTGAEWSCEDVPEDLSIPVSYRDTVSMVLGDRAEKVGLAHARR